MTPPTRPLHLEVEPRLVEEAVFRELFRREEGGDAEPWWRYARERDRILEGEPEPARRERALEELHARRFREIGLEENVLAVLSAFPDVVRRVQRAVLRAARSGREQGAELRVAERGPQRLEHTLLLRLLPDVLADRPALERALAADLVFSEDMLDPGFGYSPDLGLDAEPAALSLARDRYLGLWTLSVATRVARRFPRRSPDRVSPDRLLARLFPSLDAAGRRELARRVSGGRRPDHAALVGLALGAGESTDP